MEQPEAKLKRKRRGREGMAWLKRREVEGRWGCIKAPEMGMKAAQNN
jgi:hypothetical protein